jgi:tryptophan 2,3-dioxygenase
MLNGEREELGGIHSVGPLTYGAYLRVPELLQLQAPLKEPPEHDEMLFIIVQQVQELWFKQMLFELSAIIDLLKAGDVWEAVSLLNRVNVIVRVLGDEVRVLETMAPQDFTRFRHVLSTSSGFESEQFRELEWASGLREQTFNKLIDKHPAGGRIREHWPESLNDVFLALLRGIRPDAVESVAEVYRHPPTYRELYWLAEALSEYEVLFSEWRFHHIKLVERTIGDHSPGTAGSTGAGYLGKTMSYRFFPELWEARNVLTAQAPSKR